MPEQLPPQNTAGQRYAKSAWQTISRVKDEAKKQQDPAKEREEQAKFSRHAKQMPMRIITSGLGPAYAFVRAKASKNQILENLCSAVSDQVSQDLGVYDEEKDLLQHITENDALFLQEATDIAMAYLLWVKRFAEAELVDDSDLEVRV